MTQNILVIPADAVVADYIEMAQTNNCVGILRGIPAKLQAQADAEGWVLPHVYAEPIPETVATSEAAPGEP
jgi:hypothetical protein